MIKSTVNLDEVILISSDYKEKKSKLSASDMAWQESVKKRKVQKLTKFVNNCLMYMFIV